MGENQWYTMGRLNFDLQQHTVVNSIVGFEYDAGCWLGRVVFERLQVGANQMNQRIMFQLELVGFTRVGINPLQTLKDNIPRYQNLRDPFNTPSRFGNYE
jgi:LPS-assembly protein